MRAPLLCLIVGCASAAGGSRGAYRPAAPAPQYADCCEQATHPGSQRASAIPAARQIDPSRSTLAVAARSSRQPVPPAEAGPAPGTAAGFAYSEYCIVPVRVHLLRDSETAAAITRLEDRDVRRIFGKVNHIWQAAGIHFWVESIVSEKPASTAGYEHAPSLPVEALRGLRPVESRPAKMFHVYYIGEMAPNGIFMGRDAIFVKESARLRPVPGGIDEPLPRVTAHELGHGLGLRHREDTVNLLASGTTGTSLNGAEEAIVRMTAAALSWVRTPEQFLADAEAAGKQKKQALARSMFRALAEIPGDSPVKRRAANLLAKQAGGTRAAHKTLGDE